MADIQDISEALEATALSSPMQDASTSSLEMTETSSIQSEQDEFEIINFDSEGVGVVESMVDCAATTLEMQVAQLIESKSMKETTTCTPELLKAIFYINQCIALCDNPDQYCDDVKTVSKQYTQVVLEALINGKIHEWSVLNKVLRGKPQSEYHGSAAYAMEAEMAVLHLRSMELPRLVLYAEHCRSFFNNPQQYFEQVVLVGQQYTEEALKILVSGKLREWITLNDASMERQQIANNILLISRKVVGLVARPHSTARDKLYYRAIVRSLETFKHLLVFGMSTTLAYMLFLQVLTIDRLHAFIDGVAHVCQITQAAILTRQPTQNIRDRVSAIVTSKNDANDVQQIFNDDTNDALKQIGNYINKHDMNFTHIKHKHLNESIIHMDIKTLLLLHEYMQAVYAIAIDTKSSRA